MGWLDVLDYVQRGIECTREAMRYDLPASEDTADSRLARMQQGLPMIWRADAGFAFVHELALQELMLDCADCGTSVVLGGGRRLLN